MLSNEAKDALGINDCISFETDHGTSLGMVVGSNHDATTIILFHKLSSELMKQYSLRPVRANECPMAYQENMIEVVGSMVERMTVPQKSISVINFIVPLQEVESPGFI